ncbi:MAG TPA: hypothetical protein VFS21_32590 [Roseiflexaceae bacterium]|nr:hypothetical protein [Roseiflexaceae bacterium]
MFALLFLLGPLALVALLAAVQMFRLRRNPLLLRLGELGTVMDRALRAYREDLTTLLLLGVLFAPLGVLPSDGQVISSFLLGLLLAPSFGTGRPTDLLWLLPLVSTAGIGKVLFACCVARVAQLRAAGAPVSVRAALRHGRWRAAIGLAALLAIPSLVISFFGVFGALAGLLLALAPPLLLYEGIGPFQAVRRSLDLVWRNYSALLNTLVPLLVIGWLMVSVPLALVTLVLQLLGGLDADRQTLLVAAVYLAGSAFIAPLLAQGKVQLYLYVRGRYTAPGEIMPPRRADLAPLEQEVAPPREVVQ